MSYILRPIAKEDFQAIIDYSWEHFPAQTENLIKRLLQAFNMLSEMPGIGTMRDEIMPGLRSWPIKPFVILYQEVSYDIEIFRIAHGRRQLDALALE